MTKCIAHVTIKEKGDINMKKIIALFISCLILAGCTAAPTKTTNPAETTLPQTEPQQTEYPTESQIPEKQTIPVNIYTPDENAENFNTIPTVADISSVEVILDLLIEHSMLNEGIELNHAELVGTQLNLDFNQAFLDQLCSYGTAGERMMIGCVVNTVLSVYEAETVYITVNGEIMETGHVLYDFPIEFVE